MTTDQLIARDGGNSIGISGGFCGGDLHVVWDRCMIEQGLVCPVSLTHSHGSFLPK